MSLIRKVMKQAKAITRIAFKQKPEKGERGAVPRIRVFANGTEYMSGADGEAFLDYVYYNGLFYRCMVSHTSTSDENPYDDINHGYANWSLETDFDFLATKVIIVGEDGEGWILDKGRIYHTGGKISFASDGSFTAADGKTSISKDGILTTIEAIIQKSTLTDVAVYGTIRQPFARYDGSWSWDGDDSLSAAQLHDNLLMQGAGSFTLDAGGFEWDKSQNGRKVIIMTHRYNGTLSEGGVSISAPSGKYFFENGLTKSELKLASREFVELVGVGEDDTFYGWLVTDRGNIETNARYGRRLNVLAMGFVTGRTSDGTCGMSYKSFDGEKLSCSRTAQGQYTVTVPSVWGLKADGYMVMLTGVGYELNKNNGDAPVKATLGTRTATSFTVDVSDDDSRNDGSFQFMIVNMNDWTDSD